jgi:hypothetical protein
MWRHVAGVEANDSIWMGSAIVQEMVGGLGGGFGSLYLVGGCERTNGNEESSVDGMSVVREFADDFWSLVRPAGGSGAKSSVGGGS